MERETSMGQQYGCFNSPDECPSLVPAGTPVYGEYSKDPDSLPPNKRLEHLDLVEHAALQLKHCAIGEQYRQKKNAGR